jgi:hypothetical protein
VAPQPASILVLDLKATGVTPDLARQCTAFVAESLMAHGGYAVLTMEDLKEVASVQFTQGLLGCQSDLECLANLSRGAHADLLVTGSLGQLGNKLSLNLVLIDSRLATARNRTNATAGGPKELPHVVGRALATLLGWSGAQVGPTFKLPEGQSVSFAVLDLVASGVAEQVAQNLTQILSVEIKRVQGASVISRDDIQAMLQLEGDKSRLGCDDASCLAEIGGALGVEKLVVGTVGRLADSYVISLRLVAVKAVKVDNRISESFSGPEDQLIRAVRHAGRRLLGLEVRETGTLSVTTSLQGAELHVDSAARGKLPMKPVSDLAAGAHTIRVSKSGYFDWNGDVYVDPGETSALWVELKPVPLKWYQRWWVWTIMGSAAATITATTAVALVVATGLTAGLVYVLYVTQSTPDVPTEGGGGGTLP